MLAVAHRLAITAVVATLAAPAAHAQVTRVVEAFDTTTPPIVRQSGIDEQLGQDVPRDVRLKDSSGRDLTFGDILDEGRPVVLVFAYHSCPMLCSLVLDGLANAMAESRLEPGTDYTPVTVSFDPRDTPARSAEARARYIDQAGRDGAAESWRFLTGEPRETRRLAEAVGFNYTRDARTGEYAHPAVLVFLSPAGRVTRYLYGAQHSERDFRLAAVEAGQGRVGSTLDRFVLSCYRYDPNSRSYTPYALGALKLGGGIFLVVLAGLLVPLWRKERGNRDVEPPATA